MEPDYYRTITNEKDLLMGPILSVVVETISQEKGSAQGKTVLRPMGLVRDLHFSFPLEDRQNSKGLSPGNVA